MTIEKKTVAQGKFRVRLAVDELRIKQTTNPEQKRRIGQATLLIGTCNVAASAPPIASNENQVLKRKELQAGRYWRRVFDLMLLPSLKSNAGKSSKARRHR
jgi:hypothetical protein